MFLSIIIPSYNTKDYLEQCLQSIYQETKKIKYEVIVVDNGSKYKIKYQISNIKKKYKKLNIKLIQNKTNLGFARACNQGIEKAKGDYILFLNSDTVILDRATEQVLELIENDRKIDILGCKLLNEDGTLQPSAGFFPKLRQIFYMMFFLDDIPCLNLLLKPYHQERRGFYQKRQELDWVTGAFLLTKKEVIEKIGGFDEDYFMYAEEIDFCFRAKKAGFQVSYTPEAKIVHYKEASPREPSQEAILAEFKGIKIFFQKHKPSWEMPILRLLLRAGAVLRVLFFGILLGDEEKRTIYWRAYQLV